jgi:hypothetical protein
MPETLGAAVYPRSQGLEATVETEWIDIEQQNVEVWNRCALSFINQ